MPMIGGLSRSLSKAKSLRARLRKRNHKARREGRLIDMVPLNMNQKRKAMHRHAKEVLARMGQPYKAA